MSFVNPIAGYLPNSQFVLTQTNVSTDNLSCNNLSAVNASLINLTTISFTPTNVTAVNIVAEVGNFSELYTTYLHASNISLDQTIGGHTANFVTVNADHSVTDGLYLNEQSVVLTDKSLIKRDANEVMFIGKNVSTDTTGADFLFRTGLETDAVKLRIPRTSDIVEMIALDVDTTITAGLGTFDEGVVTDLTVIDTTTLSELEVLTSASIKNLTVVGPNGLIATKAGLTNCSIVNLSVLGGMNAAGTSRFYNMTTEYFQSYLTALFEDLDSNTGNISVFGSTNISNNALIKTRNLSALNASVDNAMNVRFGITCGSVNASTTITAPTINGNISNNLAAGAGINLSTIGGVTTITNTGLVTSPLSVSVINASTITTKVVNASSITASGTIQGKTLTGNIGGNLVSGAGINLSTNIGTGITTITNTGIITDPLNLNTLNASTINVSLLNADNIEGFTKSTEYAFQATSNLNGGQSVTAGQVLDFNVVQTETPPPIYESGFVAYGYNPILKQYIVPESGRYLFGFKLFSPTTTVYAIRVGIYVNGVVKGFGGEYTYTNEAITCILDVVKGQWVDVKCYAGSALFYMAPLHSWFYGHKLTTANNLITSTTNLSIQNLSVADDMSSTNAFITNLNPTNFNMPNVTDTFNVSGICNFSNLIRCGVLQGLNISAPIIRAPNMYTSNISATTLDRCLTANISFVNASNVSSITMNTSVINGRVGDFAIAVVANEITGSHFYGNNISMTQSITCSNFNASHTVTADNIISNNTFSAPSGSIPIFTSTDLTINDKVTAGQAEIERDNNLLNIYGDKTSSPDIIITPASSRVTMTNVSTSYLTGINAALSSININASAKIAVVNTSQLNVSNMSGNLVTINSLNAYYSESEFVYYTNNAFGAPGTANAQPGVIFKNLQELQIRSGSVAFPGNIHFTRDGTTTNMIYDGNLNISSKANISNISATDLTIATSLTGAGNINITGDVSAGIISGATLTGDISGNLTAGDGISLATALGVTTIAVAQPYLSLSRTTNYIPGTSNFYYVSYNSQLNDSSGTFSYSSSAITVNATGRYVISGSGNIDNAAYTDRVNLRIRLVVNTVYVNSYPEAFGYARHQNYVPYATACYTDFVIDLTAGDVVQNRLDISKGNTTGFNSDFGGINIASGCNCMIRRIS